MPGVRGQKIPGGKLCFRCRQQHSQAKAGGVCFGEPERVSTGPLSSLRGRSPPSCLLTLWATRSVLVTLDVTHRLGE